MTCSRRTAGIRTAHLFPQCYQLLRVVSVLLACKTAKKFKLGSTAVCIPICHVTYISVLLPNTLIYRRTTGQNNLTTHCYQHHSLSHSTNTLQDNIPHIRTKHPIDPINPGAIAFRTPSNPSNLNSISAYLVPYLHYNAVILSCSVLYLNWWIQ